MKTPRNSVCPKAASYLVGAIIAVSVTVLWGWYSNQPHLTTLYVGTAAMKANAAVCFLLLATGLIGLAWERERLSIACGLSVMTIATITIAGHALGITGGIDELLVADPWTASDPGRMAVGTAVSFALAGALLAVHHTYPHRHIGRYDALLCAFLAIPLFVFFSYTFAPEEVLSTPVLGTMTLHSSLNFLFFFFALTLLTHSKGAVGLLNRNSVNARNFRVLFFLVLILPLCLGSVLNYGVQQRWIGTGIGIAIFCLFSTLIIASALAHHTILLDHWFRKLLHERRHSNQLINHIHQLLEVSADGIILFDGDMRLLHVNSGAERILGYSANELQQMTIDQLLPEDTRQDSCAAIEKYIHDDENLAHTSLPERLLLRNKDGNEVPVTATLTKKVAEEQILVMAIVKNIAALDHHIRDLEKQTNTDALTQVSNRKEFEQYCQNIATYGARQADQRLGVLMLDIDNFKKVNDSYGHSVGDDVLKHFTHTIKGVLREGDKLFRIGGEEFVIISNDLDCDNALTFAERIRTAVKEGPFEDGIRTLSVTCSIGVSLIDPDKVDIHASVERADQAMYKAKREGKDRSVLCAD